MKEHGGPGEEMSSRAIRVFIADDHGILRGALRALIDGQTDMRVVGADAVADAEKGVQSCEPDVAVVDIGFADAGGLAAVVAVTRMCPATRVIALTAQEDAACIRAALAAGAAGYVVKSADVCELLAGIRAVSRGRTFIDATFEASGFTGLAEAPAGLSARADDGISPLTPREREVMIRVAEGYTNSQIAHDLSLGVKSIETYRSRLMDKLGLTSRAELVRFALECGALTAAKSTS